MLTRLYAALCAAMILFTCALASSQTQYQVIYNFGSNGASDGLLPSGKLLPDALGNFYGTTAGGGSSNQGTVFKVTPSGTLTTLAQFTGTTGATLGASDARSKSSL